MTALEFIALAFFSVLIGAGGMILFLDFLEDMMELRERYNKRKGGLK